MFYLKMKKYNLMMKIHILKIKKKLKVKNNKKNNLLLNLKFKIKFKKNRMKIFLHLMNKLIRWKMI